MVLKNDMIGFKIFLIISAEEIIHCSNVFFVIFVFKTRAKILTKIPNAIFVKTFFAWFSNFKWDSCKIWINLHRAFISTLWLPSWIVSDKLWRSSFLIAHGTKFQFKNIWWKNDFPRNTDDLRSWIAISLILLLMGNLTLSRQTLFW